MRAPRIKLGDFFQIPLPDGRYAYCQHVNWNDQMGFLVPVFDGKTQRFTGALPPELRGLEVEVAWGYEMLEQRISTGHHLFETVV